MPGFTTHYLMGVKAYNDLPANQLKHIISKYRWLYQLGLQGPDMFFYNLPTLRHRDYRNVGSYMHEHHVSDFFSNYLKETIRIRSRQQREQALAYFSGFVCHYIGDSICHPFVYGRIGYDAGKPGKKQHGLHAELENEIDALLLLKFKKKKPSEFNQAATICLNGQEMQFISKMLANCINETYYPITYENNFRVTPWMIHISILAMRFGCRTLADPSGRKRNGVEFMESLFVKNPVIAPKLVTDYVSHPRKSLNLDHEIWCNPWDRRLASNASFPELFYRALAKCSTVYYLLNTQLVIPLAARDARGSSKKNTPGTEPEEIDLSGIITELGNYSYHSGLPV